MKMGKDQDKRKNFYLFIDPDLMTRILHMYVEGMPVEDIGSWVGLSGQEVNEIIDTVSYAL